MPTLSNANIPTPKSWDEFEEITRDALMIKWESADLQRNGRQGQAQAGVDIYGHNYSGFYVGVQCKKYDLGLDIKTIMEEIDNAEAFEPKLEFFYFATTSPTDATIQKEIRIISKKRKDAGKFAVGIFFWNDIVQELVTNEAIFKKHFPQFNLGETVKLSKRLLSILDISFHGLNIKFYSDLLYGEFGLLAGEDPRKMQVVFSLIESSSMVTCSAEMQVKIKNELLNYDEYVISYITGIKENQNFHWGIANDIADRIGGHISNIENTLNEKELLVFRIGVMLAQWNRYEFYKNEPNKPIGDESIVNIEKYIKQLNNGVIPATINTLLDEYKTGNDWVQVSIADKLYNSLRVALIEAEVFNN